MCFVACILLYSNLCVVCVCVCVCVCGVKGDILFHTCHLHFECYVYNNFQDDNDG